jgi:hypothetical protein
MENHPRTSSAFSEFFSEINREVSLFAFSKDESSTKFFLLEEKEKKEMVIQVHLANDHRFIHPLTHH